MAQDLKILITGPTFIRDEELQRFEAHSITAQRLPSATASEPELCSAVQGKHGYVLGGLERVTKAVIDAGTELRAICFTGAGWTEFIPAHEYATERGIAITAAPGANAQAVAELTVALMHDRVRNVSFLSGAGFGERIRGRNFRNVTLGIIGAGNVGVKVARILNAAYGTHVLYHSPRRNLDLEFATGAEYVTLEDLLRQSDIVSLHMRRNEATVGLINEKTIALLKDGAVLINAAFADAIEPRCLYREVSSGRISAALDVAFHHLEDADIPDFRSVSPRHLLQMGVQSGFNTEETVAIASGLATNSMINLLTKGDDAAVVNPQWKQFRQRVAG